MAVEFGIIVIYKQNLENIQLEAARIVTGSTKIVSFQALYNETGWGTLEVRRKKQKLTLFYKMCNGLSPARIIVYDMGIDKLRVCHRSESTLSKSWIGPMLFHKQVLAFSEMHGPRVAYNVCRA